MLTPVSIRVVDMETHEAQRLQGTIYGWDLNALVSFCRNAIYNISLHDLTEIADQVSTTLI